MHSREMTKKNIDSNTYNNTLILNEYDNIKDKVNSLFSSNELSTSVSTSSMDSVTNNIPFENPIDSINRKLMERSFFNDPNHDRIKKQEEFAKWCYGDIGKCKRRPGLCLSSQK
jgi:hypothetical protein